MGRREGWDGKQELWGRITGTGWGLGGMESNIGGGEGRKGKGG